MKKNNMSNKSQIWFTDFVIAMVIFSLALISYYKYTTNISKQDSSAMDDLISDAKSISSSLTTGGYPTNWNSNNVVRIGFTDNYNRIDNTKFVELTKIDYNKSKKLLGTPYEYFLYFINESGDVQNIEGFCGIGNKEINITYAITAAYYYQGESSDEQFLMQFMIDNFDADVYTPSGSGEDEDGNPVDVTGNLNALITAINNYGVVVFEHPKMGGMDYNKYKDDFEDYVSKGGVLMLSGLIFTPQGNEMLGVEFWKNTGQSEDFINATVLIEDEFLTFEVNTNITFTQSFYLVNTLIPSANFIKIAKFVGKGSEGLPEGQSAIARWTYGDGKVLFFSDFDAEYFAGDFQEILEASTQRWIGAMCLPINITNINRENLVRLDRLLIHNSDQVKMVLYLWN